MCRAKVRLAVNSDFGSAHPAKLSPGLRGPVAALGGWGTTGLQPPPATHSRPCRAESPCLRPAAANRPRFAAAIGRHLHALRPRSAFAPAAKRTGSRPMHPGKPFSGGSRPQLPPPACPLGNDFANVPKKTLSKSSFACIRTHVQGQSALGLLIQTSALHTERSSSPGLCGPVAALGGWGSPSRHRPLIPGHAGPNRPACARRPRIAPDSRPPLGGTSMRCDRAAHSLPPRSEPDLAPCTPGSRFLADPGRSCPRQHAHSATISRTCQKKHFPNRHLPVLGRMCRAKVHLGC